MKPPADLAGTGLLRELLHVGIVVEDLEAACRALERLTGAPVTARWESDIGVKAAFVEAGGARLELVQYTGPIVERFGPTLARRDGVHHLCFRVDDLDEALAAVTARGFRVVPGFPVEGAHGRIAFLELEATTGLITELCQAR